MTREIDAQCARIVAKLKEAAAVDTNFSVFGADHHKYALGPTLSEAQIRAFETDHGIDLPPHYRAFLKQVGNGAPGAEDTSGAGPFYGIYPLGGGIDAFIDGQADYLATLPFISPDMPRSDWDEAASPLSGDELSNDEYSQGYGRIFAGLLTIGHQGCQSYHALVLQGLHAGRVVNIDSELHPPVFGFEANFLDWYERWLDEIISGILLKAGPNWFGYTMGGNDEHLLKVFKGADNKDVKLAALTGFCKLTSISAESADTLSTIAASGDQELRRKAAVLLTEFAYPQARSLLEALLKGCEADQLTACEAIHWHAKEHANEWIDLVGPIAAKTNSIELFQFAGYVMEASGHDCSPYLLPAASHPDEAIRSTAISAIGKGVQNSATIDAILKGLSDASPSVVHAALQAHKKAFDDRFHGAYASIAGRYKADENYILTNLGYRLKAIGYNSIRAFVADFKRGRVGRPGIWQRIFRRQS